MCHYIWAMFIAPVRPSVRPSVCLSETKIWSFKNKIWRWCNVRGPRSGPEKLSTADDAGSAKQKRTRKTKFGPTFYVSYFKKRSLQYRLVQPRTLKFFGRLLDSSSSSIWALQSSGCMISRRNFEYWAQNWRKWRFQGESCKKFHRRKLNRVSPLLTLKVSASEVRNEFVTMTAIEWLREGSWIRDSSGDNWLQLSILSKKM